MPTDADVLSQIRSALAQEYEVLRLLGRGGMAAVYLARERALGRLVAIKVLDPVLGDSPGYRTRFEREAATAAQLQHPNIVPIYRVGEAGGLAFYVMAYVEGESLGDRIRLRGRLSIPEAARLVREVATALASAHRRGIIHRDVKPHNVLIDRETSRAMVTDFGIARTVSTEPAADPDGEHLTGIGMVMGTPRYMSPEQAAGTRDLTPASDLYALGVIFYELVAGQYPYRLSTPPNFQLAHLTQSPIPIVSHIGDFPRPVEEVINRLLAKDPADRPQSGDDVCTALDAAAGAGTGPGEVPRGRPTPWRLGLGLAATAAVVGALVLGQPEPVVPDARQSILVGFFENTTGDKALDWLRVGGVEQLAQSLARWEDLQVVHVERLLDLARRAGFADGRTLSREDALRLAREAAVGTATVGSIVRLGETIRLSVRVYDVRRGDLITTATVETRPDSTLPFAFASLADQILDLAGVPRGALAAAAPPTRSIEAYRAYVDGVAARSRWDLDAARHAFEAAIRADPGFALAYYELSQALLPVDLLGPGRRFVDLADSALAYATERPPKERLLIEAYHAFVHADFPEARRRYGELIGRDSTIADAWVGLGDAAQYDLTLRRTTRGTDSLAVSFTDALRAYERALALDGSDHRVYGSLASVLAYGLLEPDLRIPVFREPPPGDIKSVFLRVPVGAYQAVLIGDSIAVVNADSLSKHFSPAVLDSLKLAARERVMAVVDRWIAIAPDEGEPYLLKARLQHLEGNVAEALTTLDRADRLGAQLSLPLPVLRLMMLLESHRFEDAVTAVDAIPAAVRGAIPALLMSPLANTYLSAGRVREARNFVGPMQAAAAGRRQTEAVAQIGNALLQSTDLLIDVSLDRVTPAAARALETEFDRRLASVPDLERKDLTEIMSRPLVAAYATLGDTASLNRWRRRVGQERPRGMDALAAFRAGDRSGAERLYAVAARDTAGGVMNHVALARTAEGIGRPREALAHYARADSVKPATLQIIDPSWIMLVRSYPARAAIFAAEGDTAHAAQWYRRFLEVWKNADADLMPDIDRARKDLGLLTRLDQGDRGRPPGGDQ